MLAVDQGPLHDPARLAALRRTALLDAPAIETFDRLTRLAARVLRAPVSLVSLVEGTRQFFAGSYGLPEPWRSRRETPLSHSFCQWLVCADQPLSVVNALEDPRVQHSLAIQELGVVAYLGVPLRSRDGHILGAFCVIDHAPRQWTQDDERTLHDLASAVSAEIELRTDLELKRWMQCRLSLHCTVTGLLAGDEDVGPVVDELLQVITENLGWSVGELWWRNQGEDVLARAGAWCPPDDAACRFVEQGARLTLRRGEAMAGKVWETGRPVWIEDVARHPEFPRAAISLDGGLLSGFGIPLRCGGGVSGVVAFYGRGARPLEPDMVETVASLGSQIGAFIERKHAEEERRSSEERFRLAFEEAPIGMALLLPNGRFGRVNRALCAMVGYTESELLATSPDTITHPDDVHYTECLHKADAGELSQIEKRFCHNDGRVIYALVGVSLVRDSHDRRLCYIAHVQDFTERRSAEEALRLSEERFRAAFEQAPIGMALVSPELRIVRANDALCGMLGYTAEEAPQVDLRTVFHPEELEDIRATLKRGLAGEEASWVTERRLRARNGQVLRVRLGTSLIRDAAGQPLYFITQAVDVTEQRRAEAALREAKEAAEAATRAKSDFLAVMSHEIRTPLNGILGAAELALDTELSPEQREYLGIVRGSGERLLSVINDILDFSKIEAGKLELERSGFLLRDLLHSALLAHSLRAVQKGVELVCRVDPTVPDAVIGDSGRLWQVLVNLLSNAVKFTEAGEVVLTVDLEDEAPTGVCLRFAVRDTGIGIPEEKQERIFHAFAQADTSVTRKYGGTGLGLAIAARLVSMMGGELHLESRPGHGSTFWFNALLEGDPHPAPPPPIADLTALKDARALVVDDNQTNLQVLQETLTRWGMDVTALGDPLSAVARLKQEADAQRPYAIALLDLQMPRLDGLTLASWIRETPALARLPVLILSSAVEQGQRDHLRELGVSYLTKPVCQTELRKAVAQALGVTLAPPAPPARTPQAARPLRILLAEDEEANQLVASRLLTRAGHSVTLAQNGREALDLLEQQPFDLLLLDVQMPELGGFETARLIREQEQGTGRHLPIVAMTAFAMKGDRERGLESGMDGYVTKPVRSAELLQSIEDAVPPAPTTAAEIGPESVLDRPALLDAVHGDRELLARLVEGMLRTAPQYLREVEDAARSGDAPRLERAAHKLKGAVLTVRAGQAAATAGALEELARTGRLAAAGPKLQTLKVELERLLAALPALIPAPSGNGAKRRAKAKR